VSRQFNVLTRRRSTATSVPLGRQRYEIKGGADYSNNKVYNAFFRTSTATTPSAVSTAPHITYSFGAINCGTATAPQIEAAVLENFSKAVR